MVAQMMHRAKAKKRLEMQAQKQNIKAVKSFRTLFAYEMTFPIYWEGFIFMVTIIL